MARKEKKAGKDEAKEDGGERERQETLAEEVKPESIKGEGNVAVVNVDAVKIETAKAEAISALRVDFIPFEHFSAKNNEEKLKLIIDRTKDNIIVVIEGALTPEEEVKLIQETMGSINTENYFGIEFYRIERKDDSIRERLASMLSKRRSGLTIVGPKKVVEEIKREPEYISLLTKT